MSDVSLQIQRGRWWLLNDGIPPGEKTLAGGDQGFDEKCHQKLAMEPSLGPL